MITFRHLLFLAWAIFLANPGMSQKNRKKAKAAEVIEATQDRVVVRNLSAINTPYFEFSPTYYQNGIVFVSSRQRGGLIDPKLNEPYFELFYAKLDKTGTPYQPRLFSLEINAKYHEGPVTFTSDANRMFFSRNNSKNGTYETDSEGVSRMQIFQANRGLLDWENIQLLPFNSSEFKSLHPTISEDGLRLYFSSDRPGGFGGMDIYVSEFIDGTWLDPINLGPDINSSGNEVFPFIHPTGVLFFSSDGHKGFGGLDLYLVDISQRQWGKLVNMGEPFNSQKDDFGFTMSPTGTTGFFSSSRDGGLGKDDLYEFTAPDGLEGVKVATQVLAKVQVLDADTKRPVNGAKIRIYEQAADGSTRGGDIYEMELLPNQDSSGTIKMVERRKTTVELGEPDVMVDKEGSAILTLDPQFNYTLLIDQEGYKTVEKALKLNIAESFYEVPISLEKRACINLSGIVKSAGYNKPIPNTEIKIQSTCSASLDVVKTNVEGKFEYCLEAPCLFTISAGKTGFAGEQKEISTVNLRGGRSFDVSFMLSPDRNAQTKSVLDAGMVIILEGISYDFNKSAIRKGTTRDLETLASLMLTYPSLWIEIGAHTDSRGTTDYNQVLSEARAVFAKDFLLKNGIAEHRILAQGYGESRLRNQCKDGVTCSEGEHNFNRRIEVKVLQVKESIDLQQFNQLLKR